MEEKCMKPAKLPKSFQGLSSRRQKLLLSKLAGKTNHQAALDAGYAPSTARVAGQKIMNQPEVQRAARDLITQAISSELIAKRLREGLDATLVRFIKRGRRTDRVEVVDYAIRLSYIKFLSEMAGYMPKTASNEELGPVQFIIDI